MPTDPVVIVSTLHCGSSSLGEILDRDFRIYMGERFLKTKAPTSLGSKYRYEDPEILKAISRAWGRKRDRFMQAYLAVIEKRRREFTRWGFKVGGWAVDYLHQWLLEPFERPIILHLERDIATTRFAADHLSQRAEIIRRLLGDRPRLHLRLSEVISGRANALIEDYLTANDYPRK